MTDGFHTYEARLDSDFDWAMMQGSLHFQERNDVWKSVRKITARLDDLAVPHALIGGIALFRHGYRRFTQNVDLLVAPEDFKNVRAELLRNGYRQSDRHERWVHDQETGVRIGFHLSGVQRCAEGRLRFEFPTPNSVSVRIQDTWCASLAALINIKLMSGIACRARMRDLADVQELIKAIRLPATFVNALDPVVQAAFRDVWCEPEPED
jgi:hypothetical protein